MFATSTRRGQSPRVAAAAPGVRPRAAPSLVVAHQRDQRVGDPDRLSSVGPDGSESVVARFGAAVFHSVGKR